MSDKTGIEWTDATWNPVRGCSRVSEGCRNCYAETVAARFSGPGLPYEGLARRTAAGEPRWTGKVRVVETALEQPLRWTRPRRIFVNSMSDLFHERLPDADIDRVFAVMLLAPRHTFQILTKRAERMRAYLTAPALYGRILDAVNLIRQRRPDLSGFGVSDPTRFPARWIWLGVSVEDQVAADERIPLLLDTPAAGRFLSCEPLLGPIDFRKVRGFNRVGLDLSRWWVIVGGESGPNARTMHVQWARQIRDLCEIAGVPFFFKQWGEWAPDDPNPPLSSVAYSRVGKKAAGALLDGREHRAFPGNAR